MVFMFLKGQKNGVFVILRNKIKLKTYRKKLWLIEINCKAKNVYKKLKSGNTGMINALELQFI